MYLIKLATIVLNVERINGIQDHWPGTDPDVPGDPPVTRVLFDQGHIDLSGMDAKVFRRWYRRAARNLLPRRDEAGEELLGPEDQIRRALDVLLSQIDQARPRDQALRTTAHHLSDMLDRYLTGELEPMRTAQFSRRFALPQPDSWMFPDVASP